MFRAHSAHHQERQIVSIHPLVAKIFVSLPEPPGESGNYADTFLIPSNSLFTINPTALYSCITLT